MDLPKVVKIKQRFIGPEIEDIAEAVAKEFTKADINAKIKPNMNIAITAGSRGIANIAAVTRAAVTEVKKRGAHPFIVPAMGSHGGARAEGQIEVLASLGITEKYCGAPIRATMEVVNLGETETGAQVYMDKIAYESDGVILINRIKLHTDFSSTIESGLMKIASVGLGNHKQALAIHARGVIGLKQDMPAVAQILFATGKILMGIGLVENAFEETALLEAIPVERIPEREKELLVVSKKLFPSLPIEKLDTLHIDEMGKNYSGSGMDTNVIGRLIIEGEKEPEKPNYRFIIVSDLSEESHGNSTGVGLADLTTERLYKKIDLHKMNENVLTSTFLRRANIPMVRKSDKEAIQISLQCMYGVDAENFRFMRIPNTLHLEEMYVSEALIPEVKKLDNIEILSEPMEMKFDQNGYFTEF